MRVEKIKFTKLDFLYLFSTIHVKIFITRTILSAQKKSNLILYNLDVVLDLIKTFEQKKSKTLSSRLAISSLQYIFSNFQTILESKVTLLFTSENISILNNFRFKLKRYIKENIVSIYSRELIKNELKLLILYKIVKTKRDKLLGNIAFKFNSITVKIIRAIKRKQNESALKKTKRVARVAAKRLENELVKVNKTQKKT